MGTQYDKHESEEEVSSESLVSDFARMLDEESETNSSDDDNDSDYKAPSNIRSIQRGCGRRKKIQRTAKKKASKRAKARKMDETVLKQKAQHQMAKIMGCERKSTPKRGRGRPRKYAETMPPKKRRKYKKTTTISKSKRETYRNRASKSDRSSQQRGIVTRRNRNRSESSSRSRSRSRNKKQKKKDDDMPSFDPDNTLNIRQSLDKVIDGGMRSDKMPSPGSEDDENDDIHVTVDKVSNGQREMDADDEDDDVPKKPLLPRTESFDGTPVSKDNVITFSQRCDDEEIDESAEPP